MWLVAYDGADSSYIQRGDKSYWGFRDGSPLRTLPALWVPHNAVRVLSSAKEEADLHLIRLRNTPPLRSARVLGSQDSLSELTSLLDSISLPDVILALEFTTQQNWSTNVAERLRIIYDNVRLGIPTVYALPQSGVRLGETSRRGDRNPEHRALNKVLEGPARTMVEKNRPVTLEWALSELRRQGLDPDSLSYERNPPDPKVPLFCRTAQDSFASPCCTVQFDEVVGFVPEDWRVAGCQLGIVYRLIGEVIRFAERYGKAPDIKSGLFNQATLEDERTIHASPPKPRLNRNRIWDSYHETHGGYPNGSLWNLKQPFDRLSKQNNYSIHLPRIGRVFVRDPNQTPTEGFRRWVEQLDQRPHRRRSHSRPRFGHVPPELLQRPLYFTYVVATYAGTRVGAERWENVNQRTYAGKAILVDMCATRLSVESPGRPRAMHTDASMRNCVLAVDLPMPATELFGHYERNSRYDTFVRLADILVLDDGGYLGRLWWPDNKPVRIF